MNLKIHESISSPKSIISNRRELLTRIHVEIEMNMLRVSNETLKYKNKKLYSFPVDAFVGFGKDKRPSHFWHMLYAVHVMYHENTNDNIKSIQVLELSFCFLMDSPTVYFNSIKFDSNLLSFRLNNNQSIFFASKRKYFKCLDFILSAKKELGLKIN